MFAFLKLLLAVIVVIILLIVVAFYLIKWKIKSWWGNIVETVQQEIASGVPAFRIRLQRIDDGEDGWKNAERMEELTQELLALDFTRIGDFHAAEAHVGIRAFQHHEHQMYAVIYDHFVAGTWCDMYRKYEDKTTWTYSNRPDSKSDLPPWSNVTYMPDASLEEVLQDLLAKAPSSGYLKSGADKFVKSFEGAYAREMNWRIARGGTSEAEIRRVREDGDELTDEDILLIQEPWKVAISAFLSERMVENWKIKTGMSDDEFEMKEYRLLGIHKRIRPKQILAIVDEEYYDWGDLDVEDMDAEDKSDIAKWKKDLELIERGCEKGSPISVFHAFLKRREMSEKFERLGTVDKPIKGEIWLRPSDEYEDEEEHEGIDLADFDNIETE